MPMVVAASATTIAINASPLTAPAGSVSVELPVAVVLTPVLLLRNVTAMHLVAGAD
jgi:hypothetical protein